MKAKMYIPLVLLFFRGVDFFVAGVVSICTGKPERLKLLF
jgi:hypothetical protein